MGDADLKFRVPALDESIEVPQLTTNTGTGTDNFP
jgi:hypothetical protein